MKVSVATIKRNKVFLVFCKEKGVSKENFIQAVQNYYLENYTVPVSFYPDTHDDTLTMIVIPDVNQDHEGRELSFEI